MGEVNREQLTVDIREIVGEICEVEPEEVTMEANFVEDLGMDSMQALEIMASLEKKYSIQIPEEYLGKIMDLTSLLGLAEDIISKN